MAVKATASDTGVSVKKVKPIIDLIRGKQVNEALNILSFLPSPIAAKVSKLVKSAIANAGNELMLSESDLSIITIYANEGSRTKRVRARAKGRVARIIRRNSHITVIVDQKESNRGE